MRSRTHSGKLSLVLLFICIFAFWWGIAVLAESGRSTGTPASPDATPLASNTNGYIEQGAFGPIAVQVAAVGSAYTYSGSVPLSSSCDQLGEGVAVRGKNPAHVTVLLTVMKPLIACAAAAESSNVQPFSVSVSTGSGAKAVLDGLTVNGVIVQTTVKDSSTN